MPPELAFGLRDGDGGGGFTGCTREIEAKETGRDAGAAGRGSEGAGLASSSSAFLLVVLENERKHRNGSLQAGTSSETSNRGDCANRPLEAALLMAFLMSSPH